MNHNKRELRDKELIALYHEQNELHLKSRKERQMVSVEPYQKGWKSYWVIKKEVRDSMKNAHHLQEALDLVNCVRLWFRMRKAEVREKAPHHSKLGKISQNVYDGLSDQVKKYFYLAEKTQIFTRSGFVESNGYRLWALDKIQIRVVENIITQEHVKNEAIELRLKEIDRLISKNNGWDRLHRLLGWSRDPWGHEGREKKQRVAKRAAQNEVREFYSE